MSETVNLSLYDELKLDRIKSETTRAANAATASAAATAANTAATLALTREQKNTTQAVNELRQELAAAEQQRYTQQVMANVTQAQQYVASQPAPADKTQTGVNYLFGRNGAVQNPVVAYVYLKQAAAEGSMMANYYMGNLAMSDMVYPRNEQLAMNYYLVYVTMYVQQFCKTVDDINSIASKYFNGEGCEQNRYVAFLFWKQAEEYKNSITLDNLGNCYQNGLGTHQDAAKALQYFETTAKEDDPYALNRIGDIHWFPKFHMENDELALEYWIRAACEGDSDAKHSLDQVYKENHDKTKKYLSKVGIMLVLCIVFFFMINASIFWMFPSFAFLIAAIVYFARHFKENKFNLHIMKILRSLKRKPLKSNDGTPYIFRLSKHDVFTMKEPVVNTTSTETESTNTNSSIPQIKEEK